MSSAMLGTDVVASVMVLFFQADGARSPWPRILDEVAYCFGAIRDGISDVRCDIGYDPRRRLSEVADLVDLPICRIGE